MNIIKRILRKVFKPYISTDVPGQGLEAFNWDNCNPKTNGEYFFIAKNAKNWDICLDIGANTGNYASEIINNNPNCRVICFEPNSKLNGELKGNGLKEIFNYAVSDSPGMVAMNFDIENPTQSSIHRKSSRCETVDVETITIDAIVQKLNLPAISLIKIDTEGHELAVLRGGIKTFSERKADMVQFEYGGTYPDASVTLGDVYDVLKENYIICHMMPNGLLPMRYSNDVETFRYSNWVAISRSIYR
jgi:FkbM family methyltransferase